MTPEQQGAALLTVVGAGVGLAVFVYSRDAFVFLVWALGAAAVWWAAKRPNKVQVAANPAPPPLSERGSEKEPQVTAMRDVSHPNRWIVTRESPWLTEEIDKEAGTI